MSPTDRTPLLENGNDVASSSVGRRFFAFVETERQPSWTASYKYFIFGAWLNVLLLFVPLSIISHHLNWDAALRFLFSFIAIVPLAKVCQFRTNGSVAEYLFPKLASRGGNRPDGRAAWSDTCRTIERVFWQCCGNYCWNSRSSARSVLYFI
jgi:hypothetical protein